jgi:membrane-associated protein
MDVIAIVQNLVHIFLHLDQFLGEWVVWMGPWLYAVLFAVIFCETGLVVTPFLPGDSLLFAVGALAANADNQLSVPLLLGLLIVAAILGDAVNYAIGYWVGPAIFKSDSSRLLNKKHLERTHAFYEKYGGKTIVLARFIPIIRTFAPFVAGIGQMRYSQFALFNVTGAIAWVAIFLIGGWHFGDMPWVKTNFHIVLVAIIIISIMPPVVEYILSRWRRRPEAQPAGIASEETPV